MPSQYDVIVVGGGHNGLICGAYLAKAGKKVLVLERRGVLGGVCVTEAIWPGYRVSTTSYVMSMMQYPVIKELELQQFGFELLPAEGLFVPFPDGRSFVMWDDPRRTAEEVAKFSRKDARIYPEFDTFLQRASKVVRELLWETPPSPLTKSPAEFWRMLKIALKLRGLERDFFRFVDLMTVSIADFLDQYFESDEVKAVLAYYGSIGTFGGPKTPGTAYVLLHHLMGDLGGAGGWGFMRGGMGGIPGSVARSAARWGMETRTDAPVAEVLVRDGRATGVRLVSGETITANVVVSNADPKTTFLKLLDDAQLPPDFVADIRNFRVASSAFKVNLALSELPQYTAFTKNIGLSYPTYVHIGPSIEYLEQAYLEARQGRPSRRPFISAVVPTVSDPDLAPPGYHILNLFGGHAPYELKGTTWEQERECFANDVIETMAEYAPNIPDAIVHRHVLLPPDLESIYGLPNGNIFHGELTLDQLFFSRPAPGYADYRTPVKGLYLCGSGTHPGGGVMGMSGHNAAREILKDS